MQHEMVHLKYDIMFMDSLRPVCGAVHFGPRGVTGMRSCESLITILRYSQLSLCACRFYLENLFHGLLDIAL